MKKRKIVYDLYWYYAFERQNIFLKKRREEKKHGQMIPFYKNINFVTLIV